jgi:hypothetical protein
MALALMIAFLFSRRSFSAVSSYFYIESAEPLLVFGMLLAWSSRRLGWYWTLLFLAIGCKEDMALYIGAFGVLLAFHEGYRRLGAWTAMAATAWLLVAMTLAIPHWRTLDSLAGSNQFVGERYALANAHDAFVMLTRVASWNSMGAVVTLASTSCVHLPAGAVMDGHRGAWPSDRSCLCTRCGKRRGRRSATSGRSCPGFCGGCGRRATVPVAWASWLPWLIVVVTALIDLPLPRRPRQRSMAPGTGRNGSAETALKQYTAAGDAGGPAQSHPHLPRRLNLGGLSEEAREPSSGDYVLITRGRSGGPLMMPPSRRGFGGAGRGPQFELTAESLRVSPALNVAALSAEAPGRTSAPTLSPTAKLNAFIVPRPFSIVPRPFFHGSNHAP